MDKLKIGPDPPPPGLAESMPGGGGGVNDFSLIIQYLNLIRNENTS